MRTAFLHLILLGAIGFLCHAAAAQDKSQPTLLKIDSEEKFAASYSYAKAIDYLDRSSMAWTARHKCFTCHTNFAHLIASANLPDKPAYFDKVKESLDQLVLTRWQEKGPRWDAEVVMSAATLALLDKARDKELTQLSKATEVALDRIWKVQREDGGFDWLKCDWPPMESDDEYGAAMAAVSVSAAPASYRKKEPVAMGVTKLKKYIEKNGLQRLHHRGLLIWAQSLGGDWLTKGESDEIVQSLLKLQNDDGGWNSASLGKWEREDGKPADTKNSDGYGTGFSVFILRKAGLPESHPAIRKGIAWLKKNQRESGRWYTRSLSRDNKHYLTNAGTAMAIMAISSCNDK